MSSFFKNNDIIKKTIIKMSVRLMAIPMHWIYYCIIKNWIVTIKTITKFEL